MPGADMTEKELLKYRGRDPAPADFSAFWKQTMERLRSVRLTLTEEPAAFRQAHLKYSRLTLRADDGCLLRAKYIRPEGTAAAPIVVQFHDYPAASRSWFHLSRYAAVGCAVLAPDCRGQGGESEAGQQAGGPTAYGPLFHGLEGPVEDMYLYRLFEDALLWTAAAHMLAEGERLLVYGEGQGGGLALACAALYPEIALCGAHYPMLCDYRRVWEMDYDNGAYAGLNYYFRWRDPMHRHAEETFAKLAYVDVKNLAPLIQCPTLVSTGLLDMVSPPSAQYAIVNGMTCPKRHAVYPKHGHELNNFFENEWLTFILEGGEQLWYPAEK